MTRIQSNITSTLIAIATLVGATTFAQAETAPALASVVAPASVSRTTLTLSIEGVRSTRGKIMAALLKADASAGIARRVNAGMASPVAGTTTLVFEGLEPGDYAIQLFHDENGNGEMDSNLFGIPSEGYAFSNRARGSFGPPKFEQMKFTVTAAPAATAAVMNY
jgi:uncharacterized protein (DUF2141 family)